MDQPMAPVQIRHKVMSPVIIHATVVGVCTAANSMRDIRAVIKPILYVILGSTSQLSTSPLTFGSM